MSPTLQTLVADANAFSPRHLSLTEADRLSMLAACDAEHLNPHRTSGPLTNSSIIIAEFTRCAGGRPGGGIYQEACRQE